MGWKVSPPRSRLYRLKAVPEQQDSEHVGEDDLQEPILGVTAAAAAEEGVVRSEMEERTKEYGDTVVHDVSLNLEAENSKERLSEETKEPLVENDNGTKGDDLDTSAGTDDLLTAEAAISAVLEEAERTARIVWSDEGSVATNGGKNGKREGEEEKGDETAPLSQSNFRPSAEDEKLFDDDIDHSLSMSASALVETLRESSFTDALDDIASLELEVFQQHRKLEESGFFEM